MDGNQTGSVEEDFVLLGVGDGVATVTINRPSNFNALSSAMIDALQAALDGIAAHRDIRVVVLAASGRAFCAGHDLRELRAHDDEQWHRALFERCSRMMTTIQALPQPVIAKVQGVATAAGCQLVASCDMAVASVDARFATSGINLGLFCSTPAVAISRALPAKQAAEMLFTGAFIDARRAVEIGLINRAVTTSELDHAVSEIAAQVASQSTAAIVSGKRLLRALNQMREATLTLGAAYALAGANMARDMQSVDAKQGIDAFLKKTPRGEWQDR